MANTIVPRATTSDVSQFVKQDRSFFHFPSATLIGVLRRIRIRFLFRGLQWVQFARGSFFNGNPRKWVTTRILFSGDGYLTSL